MFTNYEQMLKFSQAFTGEFFVNTADSTSSLIPRESQGFSDGHQSGAFAVRLQNEFFPVERGQCGAVGDAY
jgi:hypothetical protein